LRRRSAGSRRTWHWRGSRSVAARPGGARLAGAGGRGRSAGRDRGDGGRAHASRLQAGGAVHSRVAAFPLG